MREERSHSAALLQREPPRVVSSTIPLDRYFAIADGVLNQVPPQAPSVVPSQAPSVVPSQAPSTATRTNQRATRALT
jgi:hypothetical protein